MFAQDYLTLRFVHLKPSEEWANGSHDLAFLFTIAGGGEYISGSATRRVASGDVLVLGGASSGKLRVDGRGEFTFRMFSLGFEHLLPLFATSELGLLQTVEKGFKDARLYPASSPLARECHRLVGDAPPEFNLDHRGQLLRVAAAILTAEFKTRQPQREGFVGAEEHLMQVFGKLSADEFLSLSVGELAVKFSCSRRHLNRLFHHHFGFSVAALRMEMRLLKAVSLLRDPHAKIIRVAEKCGFNHLGLFNICFKRRFGTTPSQHRKRSISAEAQPVPLAPQSLGGPVRVPGLTRPAAGQIRPALSNGGAPGISKPFPKQLVITVKPVNEIINGARGVMDPDRFARIEVRRTVAAS